MEANKVRKCGGGKSRTVAVVAGATVRASKPLSQNVVLRFVVPSIPFIGDDDDYDDAGGDDEGR